MSYKHVQKSGNFLGRRRLVHFPSRRQANKGLFLLRKLVHLTGIGLHKENREILSSKEILTHIWDK